MWFNGAYFQEHDFPGNKLGHTSESTCIGLHYERCKRHLNMVWKSRFSAWVSREPSQLKTKTRSDWSYFLLPFPPLLNLITAGWVKILLGYNVSPLSSHFPAWLLTLPAGISSFKEILLRREWPLCFAPAKETPCCPDNIMSSLLGTRFYRRVPVTIILITISLSKCRTHNPRVEESGGDGGLGAEKGGTPILHKNTSQIQNTSHFRLPKILYILIYSEGYWHTSCLVVIYPKWMCPVYLCPWRTLV